MHYLSAAPRINWKTLDGRSPDRRTTSKLCHAHGKSCPKLEIFLKISDKFKSPKHKGHVTTYRHINMKINYILRISFLSLAHIWLNNLWIKSAVCSPCSKPVTQLVTCNSLSRNSQVFRPLVPRTLIGRSVSLLHFNRTGFSYSFPFSEEGMT